MRAAQVVVGAVGAIALAGGGLYAGRQLAPAATIAPAASAPDGVRAVIRGAGGAGVGGTAISGRVISVNPDSITVEVRQPGQGGASGGVASSTIVLVGSTTRVVRTTETDIKLADLKANDQVTIVGQTDAATGTVAANAVVVGGNALQQIFGGGQGGTQSPRPSGSPRPSPTR